MRARRLRPLLIIAFFVFIVACLSSGSAQLATVQGDGANYSVANKVAVFCAELLESNQAERRVPLKTLTIGNAEVPVISFRGQPYPYYSNTIYIHRSNYESAAELDRVMAVNQGFLEALGPQMFADPIFKNSRFITTAKNGQSEFATIFEVKDGKFGAITLKLSAEVPKCHIPNATVRDVFGDAIAPWVSPIAGKGRLYLIGDDLDGIDPTVLAERFRCDVIRRSTRMTRNLKETESRLQELEGRKLEPARTAYINGLPQNTAEAIRSNYQRSEVEQLQRASAAMDEIAKQFLGTDQIEQVLPAKLQQLLVEDESDVVVVVAHSDKERIYLNGRAVSLDEIKEYPARQKRSGRPRICVLLSCRSANFRNEKGWWLNRRELESLAELMLQKEYFDMVVGPRGDITTREVTAILRDYFGGRLIRQIAADHYPQLIQVAEVQKP